MDVVDNLSEQQYRQELRAELSSLEKDQANNPSEYKEARIKTLKQRLGLIK